MSSFHAVQEQKGKKWNPSWLALAIRKAVKNRSLAAESRTISSLGISSDSWAYYCRPTFIIVCLSNC